MFTTLPRPSTRTPAQGMNQCTVFGRLFRGHQYYTLNESNLCLNEEKKILKEKIIILTYLATPQHNNSCSGDHEIYKFGRPFVGYYNSIITLSVLCLGVEKKILKKIMHFHYITYMATPLHENLCLGVINLPFWQTLHLLSLLLLRQIIVKVRNTLFKGSANKRQITIITNLFII